jgi:hypothetical protein
MKILHKLQVFILLLNIVFLIFFLVKYFYQKQEDVDMEILENSIIESKPIDITDVVSPVDLKIEENGIFFYNGNTKRQVVYQNNPISDLIFSPSRNKFGYFVNYSVYDENISPDKEVVLRIENLNTRDSKQVYGGSFRTGGWEWFLNDEVLVEEGCGTECHVQILENLISGKEYILQYGVDYTWSPDKNWVFAYNYSYRTGITIGDKFGNIVYKYHILPPENETANTPLAVWSPDSSKLALIIKNSNDKEFELLIFDSHNNFKEIFQSKVDNAKKFELKWALDSKSVEVNNKKLF